MTTVVSCLDKLRAGDAEGAWSLFVDENRRLIFAVIRRYATDHDDVMDLFAHVCEQLRTNDLARLRAYAFYDAPRASFSTWLVAVLRNLIVDWFRARDGRARPIAPDGLAPLGQRIHQCIFIQGYSQREACEIIRSTYDAGLTDAEYHRALRQVHEMVYAQRMHASPRLVEVSMLPDVPVDPDERTSETETRDRISEAMQMLDADTQLAVQLFVVDGTPAADIARTLGWPNAKAVYNTVYRGLTSLRRALEKRGIRKGDL